MIGGRPKPPTVRWKVQVHEAAGEIRQALEDHDVVTVIIEDHRQAGLICGTISRSGRLRLALASETGPLAMKRFESDSKVIFLQGQRNAACRPSEEELS